MGGAPPGALADTGRVTGEVVQHRCKGGKRDPLGTAVLRIGIAGCGLAAGIHLKRLLACDSVAIVGCADPDIATASALADRATRPWDGPGKTPRPVAAFADHRELLSQLELDALAIFSPHLSHYRLAMDALQAGCHVFIEKPLSTNIQEAADIVNLARARNLLVAVGHQYRLCPSLIEASRRLMAGAIGELHLVVAMLARPWIKAIGEPENSWRFDPKSSRGGILADAGDHLIDALLWTTGREALQAGAIQSQAEPGIDLVTGAVIRLAGGTTATMAVSAISPANLFEIDYFGETGRLRVTEASLEEQANGSSLNEVPLDGSTENIDGNFISALEKGTPLCCPAEEAVDTVRLLDAIIRSAAIGQIVKLT